MSRRLDHRCGAAAGEGSAIACADNPVWDAEGAPARRALEKTREDKKTRPAIAAGYRACGLPSAPGTFAKVVRFKTPGGVIRQSRVKEQHVLHGRVRYTVQTEFGEVMASWAAICPSRSPR
jgi:hypothetical protein